MNNVIYRGRCATPNASKRIFISPRRSILKDDALAILVILFLLFFHAIIGAFDANLPSCSEHRRICDNGMTVIAKR